MRLLVIEAEGPDRLRTAFTAMVHECAGALMVLNDIVFITHRRAIVELAARHRLPAVTGTAVALVAGEYRWAEGCSHHFAGTAGEFVASTLT